MPEQESCRIDKIPRVKVSDFEGIEKIMKNLANKTSLAILHSLLKHGEACACELEPALKISQSLVTTYLRKLYMAGILGKRDDWRFTYYFVKDEYREFLGRVFDEPLSGKLD